MIHSCSYKAGAVCNNQQENCCTGKEKDSVYNVRKCNICFNKGNENDNGNNWRKIYKK